jgi:hypothetical protein
MIRKHFDGTIRAVWGLKVVTSCIVVLVAIACGGCLTGKEFRAAAGPAMESGVDSILDGLVDGLFAVIEPEANNSGSTSTAG